MNITITYELNQKFQEIKMCILRVRKTVAADKGSYSV